ncbi:MAG TPA: hypothetical protein VK206_06540 [Anaerolineales bacterium]|nr:hypothetical protein [Anaerolineales bacterium]
MRRIFRALLFWTLILSACSISVASPQTIPPSTTEAPVSIPTTAVPPNPQDCGYQWATQALPELSSSFQGSIQALQPEAQANAYAFGENCMLADGSNGGFGAMETDFKVTLNVSDLTNEVELGEWIVKVMQVITAIPKDQIAGPQPGRVTIAFQSNGNQQVINFYINQYQALSPGLSDSEIYQALQTPQ